MADGVRQRHPKALREKQTQQTSQSCEASHYDVRQGHRVGSCFVTSERIFEYLKTNVKQHISTNIKCVSSGMCLFLAGPFLKLNVSFFLTGCKEIQTKQTKNLSDFIYKPSQPGGLNETVTYLIKSNCVMKG